MFAVISLLQFLSVFTLCFPTYASDSVIVSPGIHWETDTADHEHLAPSSSVAVFYSDVEPDEQGQLQVAHLWAEYITDVVALEHSQYVESVHCGSRDSNGVTDMTITFNDLVAYDLAKKQWSSYEELLFIGNNFTHTSCVPDGQEESSRFWIMAGISYPSEDLSQRHQLHVTFKGFPTRFQDVINEADLKFGQTQIPLIDKRYPRSNSQSLTDKRGPMLFPRQDSTDNSTQSDGNSTQSDDGQNDPSNIAFTESVFVDPAFLATGPDPDYASIDESFVAQDSAAFAANGFGAYPGADNNASDIMAPDPTTVPSIDSPTSTDGGTMLASDTGRIDAGAPTPTVSSVPFVAYDGPVNMTSSDESDPFILVALGNGNIVRRNDSADVQDGESSLFQAAGGLVVGDTTDRLFSVYQDEIAAFGASRLRLHAPEMMPTTSIFVSMFPLQMDGFTNGILVMSTSDYNYFTPVICDILGQESKLFAVPYSSESDLDSGLQFLASTAAQSVLTGGSVQSCYLPLLTSGVGGLVLS